MEIKGVVRYDVDGFTIRALADREAGKFYLRSVSWFDEEAKKWKRLKVVEVDVGTWEEEDDDDD